MGPRRVNQPQYLVAAGLVHLKGLNVLQILNLCETQATDAGVADLQKALPNCKIFLP